MLDLKYSVDMVRLKTRISNFDFKNKMCNNGYLIADGDSFISFNPSCEYYRSSKFKDFKHNFVFKENPLFSEKGKIVVCDYSFWLGFQHNTEKASEKYNLVVEYNPNKTGFGVIIEKILKMFFTSKFSIVGVDGAIDIPVNINDVIVEKAKKRKYKFFDYGLDDKTFYIGEGHGRIKVYNKKIEAGLDYELTRYEVSIKIGCEYEKLSEFFKDFNMELPRVYYLQGYDSNDLTLKALIYAVLNGYRIDDLSRVYKDRIKDFICKNSFLDFDIKELQYAILRYFEIYKSIVLEGF